MVQKKLSYGICQSIGMALDKLELLEKQGCKVEEASKQALEESEEENYGNV